ncbi:hypothetical protein [Cohnella yongneupensis]|uniref:Uncharacterized protein n=1 Tax=Cohnella yongneupensis TaxID=425006 RepID=A0ABW0QX36_9BACL
MINPIPEGISMEDRYGELVISRRWFSSKVFFLLFFAIFWDVFLFSFYKQLLSGDSVPTMAALFPLLHVGVGIGITYSVITGFVNKTVISVSPDLLGIRHTPLPWRGNRTLHRSDFIQLYVEEVRQKNSVSYRLNAVLNNHKKLKLLSGIYDRSQAVFFEKEIEKYMGIQDEPISGEA